jgi:hypothetical protein
MTRQSGSAACDRSASSPKEIAILATILFAFLVVNLLTASRSPVVWKDEVFFADPAINLATGHGFTSTAWPDQRSDEFFAENVPLYSFILSFWIRAFGIGPTSVRSISYFYMAGAALMIWLGLARTGLVKSSFWRLAAITTILLSNEVTFCYRSARYDALGILFLSILFVGFTIPARWARFAVALVFGSLLPLAGLQLVIFAGVISAIIGWFLRGRSLQYMAVLFAGIFVGMGTLGLIYWHKGVLVPFLKMLLRLSSTRTTSHFSVSTAIIAKLSVWKGILYAPTLLIGLTLIVGLLWAQRRTDRRRWRSPALFGLASGTLAPLGMSVVYDFPVYYVWMGSIPLILMAAATVDGLQRNRLARSAAWATAAAMTLMAALGLPLRLLVTLAEWQRRDYAPVQRFVMQNVAAEDHVATDFGAYYPVKLLAADCYLPTHFPAMSDAEKARINVLVFDTANMEGVFSTYGNDWVATATMAKPPSRPLFSFLRHSSDQTGYHLTVFRRNGLPRRSAAVRQ